jgi:hypothetical protein
MEKQQLLSFIQKYNLGGTINAVAWESNGTLKTRFISDDKSLLGSLEFKSITLKEFDKLKVGIYNTSALVKMLGILGDEIDIKLNTVGEKPISIKFEDEEGTKISYALSDIAIIPSVPSLKHEPDDYEIVIKVTEKFAQLFIKATSAMSDMLNFTVSASSKKTDIIFGQTDVNTNLAILNTEVEKTSSIDKKVFDAKFMKEILVANKGVESKLLVSSEGFAKVVFETNEYTVTYYLVAKE